jgi:hypothetical protein
MTMQIQQIAKIAKARILCGEKENPPISRAFASDLMSDVLTLEVDQTLLITGLANVQAVRTAEMSDINCILFARNKRVTEDMIEVAKENHMVLMQTTCSVYHTAGLLYEAGIKPIF